jgi:hypothetical protein
MPRHIMPFRSTNAATRHRPHWDDTRSACCNMFPPVLATLVLIQSVVRDGLKTALALVILLALFGALAAALVWWPWARPDEQAQPAASAQESHATPTRRVVPQEAPAGRSGATQATSLRQDTPLEDWPWA